jgi:hypothetical protein
MKSVCIYNGLLQNTDWLLPQLGGDGCDNLKISLHFTDSVAQHTDDFVCVGVIVGQNTMF